MSKFSRVKKILSLIVGITNLNLMNIEAVKKVKSKKMSPNSKAVLSAENPVMKRSNAGNTPKVKKNVNFNKKSNKKKTVDTKNVKSLKKNVSKMSGPQKKRALRSLSQQKKASKTNGGYFIDKNGKPIWRNIGITSAWGVPPLGAVGTGAGVVIKGALGSKDKENTSSDVNNPTDNDTSLNISSGNISAKPIVTDTSYQQGNTNTLGPINDNNSGVPSGPTSNDVNDIGKHDVSTQYSSFTNNLQSSAQQVFINQNDDLPAENYDEALELVKAAFESEILPKGNPISLKASFSGGALDSNKGNGHSVKADIAYHSKRVQHNLKLFLWQQLPKSVLEMTANEFEVWLALQFLKNENLNEDFFDHEFTFGDGDDKVGIKLGKGYNIHWALGKNVGNGVKYRYGSNGNFNVSDGGIVEKPGGNQKVSFSYNGSTTYGKIPLLLNTAEKTYEKQLEAAVKSCRNWEKLEINGKVMPGFEDSLLKHLDYYGGGNYKDVVNSIKDTLCPKNIKIEKKVIKFSASKRLKDLGNNKRAMNFLRMISLVRYFALYISFGYKFNENNKLNDSLKQLLSAVVMASIDRLYDPSGDMKTIHLGLWKCGGIINPEDMIDYGLGTVYRTLESANENGCYYIG